MKVTVIFGKTGVVVPCRDGWTVRDLIQQATQRYMKLLEQDGSYFVKTHHLEHSDGGILDPDDDLADLVDDKDKLIAVYEEQEAQRGVGSPNTSLTGRPSPDPYENELSAQLDAFQPISGEIEVNSTALKSNTPLLVRSSSDSALSPPVEVNAGVSQPEDMSAKPGITGANHALTDKGGADLRRRADVPASKMNPVALSGLTKTVEISGDHGPLGIHVVPYSSSLSGRALGLYIRAVEEHSRSKREGIFHDDECIVKINDIELMDKTFAQSQDIFRQAMRYPSVQLEVVPAHNRERYEKKLIGQLFEKDEGKVPAPLKVHPANEIAGKPSDLVVRPIENAAKPVEIQGNQSLGNWQLALPHGTSLSPTPPSKSESPSLKSRELSPLIGLGNKKMGKKLKIDLKKGPEGLGFTVVTRDSSVHGPGPILVKNILPRGAAIKDGRLQSGDRILEVNGMDIAGKTQEELVGMLRSTKQGDTVSLVVARQEEVFLPRELKGEQDRVLPSQELKDHLMFEVPLNDSGSAGLGVSLKGNKSRETGADLGIFIKSIIHGGAAFKDGRLRVNDQLIAVNGESLLSKSNHEAMETLRRSMSMEGNIRGMIQLVVARNLERPNKEGSENWTSQKRGADSSQAQQAANRPIDGAFQPVMVTNSIYDMFHAPNELMNGGYDNNTDDDEDYYLPSPLRLNGDPVQTKAPQQSQPMKSSEWEPRPHLNEHSHPDPSHPEIRHVKTSRSMDMVADESNVGSLAGQKSDFSHNGDLGPTLGLKKSSSLESLQTAMSEVKKNELPFHRPRPHMVRGRGCNESFRAAIDKSYDGPPELEDDELSDQSSGPETPASGSSRQGNGDAIDEGKKDKKKKAKEKKAKEKVKNKGKDKERKKMEDIEEQDKKTKKKGFGAMLRFGKKKEEKVKSESKTAALQKQKSEMLSEDELERMKEERERIEAKHQELREKQARGRFDTLPSHVVALPDVEDDDMDPNYARINHFREKPAAQPLYRNRTPSPQPPPMPNIHTRELSAEDPLEGLYAKVNKQRPQQPPAADSSMDRIQQLRKEYHQARREGAAPTYEDLEARRRGPEYDPHLMPGRGNDSRLAVPRYEDVERQYASLPRRGPPDPSEYPMQPWGGPPERDPSHLPGAQPAFPPYPSSRGNYPCPAPRRGMDPRQGEPRYYPQPQQRGPLRQDVPPSPPLQLRTPRYDTLNRGGYHNASPEHYNYRDNRHPDTRQKNPMTAAV
ncbi:partitioning defective 3 homolog B [Amia ocellicauda]|uniref:partitioning defective 3 homolog B n=1 Tax=Amia ocellicauda TaxID=2972642 RepID=UPI0034645A80|nr:PAR3L protein [Amia calva]